MVWNVRIVIRCQEINFEDQPLQSDILVSRFCFWNECCRGSFEERRKELQEREAVEKQKKQDAKEREAERLRLEEQKRLREQDRDRQRRKEAEMAKNKEVHNLACPVLVRPGCRDKIACRRQDISLKIL